MIEFLIDYKRNVACLLFFQILTELYTRVKGAKGNWRGAILGALYGLVECAASKILLAVARVVLAVSASVAV